MKMSAAKPARLESGPNMTPLVDVVMVILIFLMLAGSFGTAEHYMASAAKPLGDVGQPRPPAAATDIPPVRVRVGVNREGGARVDGQAVALTGDADLSAALAGTFDRLRAGGTAAKDIELVIQPDTQTEWYKLAAVYDAGLRAKFEKVQFAAAR